MLLPQLGVVPLQLLSYYIALERGCDIDKPRTWPRVSRWNNQIETQEDGSV